MFAIVDYTLTMKLLNKLRLKWVMTTKSMGHGQDFLHQLYKQYLNHNKIIHWRKGLPVYSGSTPPAFSKPAAHFLARKMMSVIQNRPFPNLMSFAINDICNARCEHCSFFDEHDRPELPVVTLDEATNIIKQAQDLGVSVINFVGGEPLMRKDLPDILRSVDKDRSSTLLFTNGWFLKKQAKTLKDAGLDTVYVSIDNATPEGHNEHRKLKGLFQRAMEGLQEAKKVGLTTGLSCCVFEDDLDNGNFDALMQLGKDMDVHEIIVFDAMPSGRMKDRQDLIGKPDVIDRLIARIQEYNAIEDFPGVLSYSYATSWESTGCCGGTAYFYVTPYGEICCCDFNPAKLGDLREEPLWKVWDNAQKDPEFGSATWGGCKTKDPAYRAKHNGATASLPDGARLAKCGGKGGCACEEGGDCGCSSSGGKKNVSLDLEVRV